MSDAASAPEWIRVAQDGTGPYGGFWTCAAATETSPKYIREDIVTARIEALAAEIEISTINFRAVEKRCNDTQRKLETAETRAESAERALAEAVKIMRPFASRDMSAINDCVDNHGMRYQSQWFANATAAARDFTASTRRR